MVAVQPIILQQRVRASARVPRAISSARPSFGYDSAAARKRAVVPAWGGAVSVFSRCSSMLSHSDIREILWARERR